MSKSLGPKAPAAFSRGLEHHPNFDFPVRLPILATEHSHGRVALSLAGVTARLRSRRPEAGEAQGNALGYQLRRRGRELGLRRAEAAKLLGVGWKTLIWWERDESPPLARAYPTIIEFLGYELWPESRRIADALMRSSPSVASAD